jgi:cephalosporin hydroxylase
MVALSALASLGAGFPEDAAWSGQPDAARITAAMEAAQFERTEHHNSWLGVEMLQFPGDLMTYQQLIVDAQPDVVVETGTLKGGLSLYLATVLSAMSPDAKLVTIDIDDSGWKQTLADYPLRQSLLDRIHFIAGDSVGKDTWKSLQPHVRNKKVLVILDSLHSRSHVLKELNLYSQLVPVGSYIVVNDTHLDGTEWVKPNRGPYAAVREFAAAHPEFEIVQQRFMVSCIHQGVLKRLR